MLTKIIFAVLILIQLFFIGYIGYNSLPVWCANPNGDGNWIVQPLCK